MQTIKAEGLVFLVLAVTIFFILLAVFVIAITVIYQRKKLNYFNEKKMMEASFKQELLKTQIEIQEQTLKTISQEIHDNIGQVLSLAKLNLGTFENIENAGNQTRIENTKELVSKALGDLRNLSRSMYGDQLQNLGLTKTIENELSILQHTGQFKTRLVVTGQAYPLEAQKEIIVYRMLQEAINNSVKHAMAKNIHISIFYGESNFSVSITDDGTGFDFKSISLTRNGMGLTSMKSRAALIGGELNITSAPAAGTTISFNLARKSLNS